MHCPGDSYGEPLGAGAAGVTEVAAGAGAGEDGADAWFPVSKLSIHRHAEVTCRCLAV